MSSSLLGVMTLPNLTVRPLSLPPTENPTTQLVAWALIHSSDSE